MANRRSEVIKNKFEMEEELSRALEVNVEKYFKEAKRIIKVLERRRKVNKEFLNQIEIFIAYAKNQVDNENLSEEKRLRYLYLIEEEESLYDKIWRDLKRNNELIESIKESTDVLIRGNDDL
jgi:hypothetical protein